MKLVLRPIEDNHPFEIEVADLFACLTRVEAEEDWNGLACISNFTDQEHADALNESALQVLTALVDMLAALARPQWGEPAYHYPGQRPPQWMELYLYPNGVPTSLHYLVGWKRQNKRRKPMAVLAYIDEMAGPDPGTWLLCLSLGVHELDEEPSVSKSRRQPRPARPVTRTKKAKKSNGE